MATVVISAHGVANAPDVGGHFWVYMQYAQGLLRLGCEVYWLERFRPTTDRARDAALIKEFMNRMDRYGLGQKVILYTEHRRAGGYYCEFIGMPGSEAEAVFKGADLLLNFDYAIDPELLSRFRRTALVDIDPGLLQFWISTGQLIVPKHKVYFTTGETVGRPSALFSDCGRSWVRIRPPICLDLWPYAPGERCEVFTTVSSWWGGNGRGEFITDGKQVFYENNKRVTFLDFVELPKMTKQPLELALCMGEGDVLDEDPAAERPAALGVPATRELDRHPYTSDAADRKVLESHGWRLRLAKDVARTPEAYQSYIQSSRGEFSCAKPSCMKFQNAWVSDRTLCYMASGKPVVVQNTGPSAYLVSGEGMFRFSTLEEAAAALAAINADYVRHCRAARELVESHFDAKKISERILNSALSADARTGNLKSAARRMEIELSGPDSGRNATTQLMAETLQEGLSRWRGAPVRIERIVREFFEDSSSFAAERLCARLDDGDSVKVFFKDLSPENQLESARVVRGTKLERGLRELQMYQQVLSGHRFGTAELYASRWEPERGIHWLFLEDAGRWWLSKVADFAPWLAAARWAARFHGSVRGLPATQIDFLPRCDRTGYWSCAETIQDKLSRLDPEDRPIVEKALKHFVGSIDRLLTLPESIIHGEYYGKNIVVRDGSTTHDIAVIDWESASIGPSFFDLASLSSGRWTSEQRQAMWRAYFDEYQLASGQQMAWNGFVETLFDLNIYQALVWLGWWPDRNFSRHFGRWMRELERVMQDGPL